MTPRALSLSFLGLTDPLICIFISGKGIFPCIRFCGYHAIGQLENLVHWICLHISLSDIKAVTIIYVTTRLIRKHFQVLGISAHRDRHSSFKSWTLLQISSWLWCWGQNPTPRMWGGHHHELHCWLEISKFLTGNKYKNKTLLFSWNNQIVLFIFRR